MNAAIEQTKVVENQNQNNDLPIENISMENANYLQNMEENANNFNDHSKNNNNY